MRADRRSAAACQLRREFWQVRGVVRAEPQLPALLLSRSQFCVGNERTEACQACDQAINQLGKKPSTEVRMDLILIILILFLLFGGGFGYHRWGYGGGIGIGGILLIVLVVYLLVGRGRF
jgi:hypothetical protein